jgi:hypothetical protein
MRWPTGQAASRKLLAALGVVGPKAKTVRRTDASEHGFDSSWEGELYLTPYELAMAEVEALLANAVEDRSGWLAKFRSGLYCLVDLLETRPELGRVLIAEGEAGGERARESWGKTMSRAARFVDLAREEPEALSPVQITAEAVVSGIYGILRAELLGSAQPRIREVVPDLTYYAVQPYFGHEVARRELVAAEARVGGAGG